jgi:purine nucleosidase
MLDTYLDFYESRSGVREAALHDPLAAAIALGAIEPAVVKDPGIEVALTGEERGWTRPVPWGPHVRVVTELAEPAGPAIIKRVLAGAEPRA